MKLEQKLLGAMPSLASSADPEKISLSVKAGAVVILPALTAVLSLVGIDAGWLSDLVNAGVGTVGSICLLWGVIRRFKK